jgi:hypothetical protein
MFRIPIGFICYICNTIIYGEGSVTPPVVAIVDEASSVELCVCKVEEESYPAGGLACSAITDRINIAFPGPGKTLTASKSDDENFTHKYLVNVFIWVVSAWSAYMQKIEWAWERFTTWRYDVDFYWSSEGNASGSNGGCELVDVGVGVEDLWVRVQNVPRHLLNSTLADPGPARVAGSEKDRDNDNGKKNMRIVRDSLLLISVVSILMCIFFGILAVRTNGFALFALVF